MRALVVEDDFVSRKLLQKLLSAYGECDIAVDGQEAVKAFKLAIKESNPYDLICMDIMMPNLDGQGALVQIRQIEKQSGYGEDKEVKVIMTTAVDDKKQVIDAFYKGGASSYFVKPIEPDKLIQELQVLGLVKKSA
ncbi:MAG: response regulator [Desulfobacteraceae bacterium]|nr:response regulator [Desulfobacteraceae bacterium]